MIEDNELKLDDDQEESEENKIVGLIQNILEQKDRILQEHKIELTADGLKTFESFVTNFDIYDRRKSETVTEAAKFANKRNTERNTIVSMLVDNMRGKMELYEHELSVAEEVQRDMIPDTNPKIKGYDIRGYYHPSKHVGGDYYDYYVTPDKKLIFLIADASGEGIPSTMVLARMQAFMYAQIREMKQLNELVENLNQYLIDTLKTETFVTMFIGRLDPASGKFEYVNAGHDAPVIFSGKNKAEELPDKGPLLGIFEDPEYSISNSELKKGSLLLLFTDGLTDAKNSENEEYSVNRLIKSVKKTTSVKLTQIILTIFEKLRTFRDGKSFDDDISILLLRKN